MRQSDRLTMRVRAVLTLLALGAIGLTALRFPPTAAPAAPPGVGDVVTFQAVVAKLRDGALYYPTLGFELRRGGYPTRDAFNWRTPLLLSAVSAVPEGAGRGMLFALFVALWCATLATVSRPSIAVFTAVAMQVGVLAFLVGRPEWLTGEPWAGVLVGISVCVYAIQRPSFAAGLGLLALFVRELAAPYCVVCALIAGANRRWRELGVWIAGACVYAAYYGWHLAQISAQRLPTDFAHSSSWLEFGGLPFLLATVHWLGWLLVLPAPLTALALVLIIAGIADARTPLHVRTASAVYVMFFLVAGKPFNDYWGLIAAPTWALACGHGARATGQAIWTAFEPLGSPHLSRSDAESRRDARSDPRSRGR